MWCQTFRDLMKRRARQAAHLLKQAREYRRVEFRVAIHVTHAWRDHFLSKLGNRVPQLFLLLAE